MVQNHEFRYGYLFVKNYFSVFEDIINVISFVNVRVTSP